MIGPPVEQDLLLGLSRLIRGCSVQLLMRAIPAHVFGLLSTSCGP